MGSNVFGTPVTVATLKAMPEYHGKNTITQQDRAKVALEKMNADGKAMDARNYVEKLQSRFRDDAVSTMCLIYNATGDTMTFVIAHDWKGRLCEAAYPLIIANGQWGAFLHGEKYNQQEKNSRAGIVYSALNNQAKDVYTEIRKPGYYVQPESGVTWQTLDNKLSEGKLVNQAKEEGGYLSGSIGNTTKPVFVAIMTLPEAK